MTSARYAPDPQPPASPTHRRRSLRTATVTVAAALSLLASAAVLPSQAAQAAPMIAASDGTAAGSAHLPFAMPSNASLQSSSKKVFAHYMPNFPISIDNQNPSNDYYQRHHLNPNGENNKHVAWGGFLRDRPLPRDPRPAGTDWRVENMRVEIRQALEAGIDGFTLNIMQLEGDPDTQSALNVGRMLTAADKEGKGFNIVLMPDMNVSTGKRSAPELAKFMAGFGKHKSAYRLKDGSLVVAPYRAENKTPEYWAEFKRVMQNTYGEKVSLVLLFDNERAQAQKYKDVAYGMSNWGSRTPLWNDAKKTGKDSPVGRAEAVKEMGKLWMQPVSIQDNRPRNKRFWESGATENLRNTWEVARRSNADWVQLVTWNDFGENSHFSPTVRHEKAFLDLNAYYITWYKTGQRPAITQDQIFLTHRTQLLAAKPTFSHDLMKLDGGTTPTDKVEVMAFMKNGGAVKLTVAGTTTTCHLPAGVGFCEAPLKNGTVSAKIVRDKTYTEVTSPLKVTSTPKVQDLTYVSVNSRR